MATVRIVIDAKLLKAANSAAKRRKLNRSQLISDALREHLERLCTAELDERDRRGYQRQPQRTDEYGPWEGAAVWPKN